MRCQGFILVAVLPLFGCAPEQTRIEQAAEALGGKDRVICIVNGQGSAACSTALDLAVWYEEIFGADLHAKAIETLEKVAGQNNLLGLSPNEAVVACDGGWGTTTLTSPLVSQGKVRAAAQALRSADLTKVRAVCERGMETGVFAINNHGWNPVGRSSSSNYASLVARTVARVDEQVASCVDGPGATLQSGASPTEWLRKTTDPTTTAPYVKVLTAYAYAVYKSLAQRGDYAEGAADYFSGKGMDPEKADSESYRRGYKKAKETCEANADCAPQESPEEEPPPPPPASSDMSTSCSDESCSDYCERNRQAWNFFKQQCEATNWSTYECKAFVYGANNCPDPAVITPHPESGYECRTPLTTEEQQAAAIVEGCERRQQVARIGRGDDGYEVSCEDLPLSSLRPEKQHDVIVQQLCWYIITDGGICLGEMAEMDLPEAGPPLPMPFGALPGGGS